MVEEEKKVKGSPPRRFKAVLSRFNIKEEKEESYEEWKRKKQLKSTGEKRKSSQEEDPGSKEETTNTPGKFRKMNGPGMIQKSKIKIKFNNHFASSSKLTGKVGGQVRREGSDIDIGGGCNTAWGSRAIRSSDIGGGGNTPRGGGAVRSSDIDIGEVSNTPQGGGAIESSLVTPQRDMVGNTICLSVKLLTAVVEGEKTGSVGKA